MSRWGKASLVTALSLCAPLASLEQVEIDYRLKSKPLDKKEDTPRPNIRIDTNLVLIPVAVTDKLARPIEGLEKQHFKLFDNKVEQSITSFTRGNEPFAMGLVFDTSGSMTRLLGESRLAANDFLRTAEPEDEFCLVEFDTTPRLTVPLTRDSGRIRNELLFSKAGGFTAMLDAIYLALRQVKTSKLERKALVIISDGEDNHSRYSFGEVLDALTESDVLIYAIGMRGLLGEFTEQTGGRFYPLSGRFTDIAAKIGADLRNRYLLGFNPTNNKRDGLYHKIEVKVDPPPVFPQLQVHWRQGYYARAD